MGDYLLFVETIKGGYMVNKYDTLNIALDKAKFAAFELEGSNLTVYIYDHPNYWIKIYNYWDWDIIETKEVPKELLVLKLLHT